MIKVSDPPIMTASGCMYPYSAELEGKFTRMSKYEDTITLYRVTTIHGNKRIWLPRNCVPSYGDDRRARGYPIQIESHPTFAPKNHTQASLIAQSTGYLKHGTSHILKSGTGTGKTVMATQIIVGIKKQTLIVVPKEDIRDQWYKALLQFTTLRPSDIGFIQGDTCNTTGKKVVIAMVQSLSKLGRYPEKILATFGLLVIDEVHHCAAEQFANVCWQVPALLRLGLSATPNRKDGRGVVLDAHIGQVLVSSSAYNLIPKVLMVASKFKVPLVWRRKNGDYVQVPLPHTAGRTMNVNKELAIDNRRNVMLVGHIIKAYKEGRAILVLSEVTHHLELLEEKLITMGVKQRDIALYIGGLTEAERAAAQKKPIMLGTYAYTAEATDIPRLDTLVMATPRSDVEQIIGRILRDYEGKQEPYVIDIVDNDSNVLSGYAKSRIALYQSINAEVVV